MRPSFCCLGAVMAAIGHKLILPQGDPTACGHRGLESALLTRSEILDRQVESRSSRPGLFLLDGNLAPAFSGQTHQIPVRADLVRHQCIGVSPDLHPCVSGQQFGGYWRAILSGALNRLSGNESAEPSLRYPGQAESGDNTRQRREEEEQRPRRQSN